MDEFGVLVESIGFRAHGKSAPMAKSKPKPQSHFPAQGSAFDDSHSWSVDELDGIFRSNVNVSKPQQSQNFFGADDIFGGSVSSIDLDSVFSTSNNRKNSNLNSRNSVGSASYDDLLGSTVPKSNPSGTVDDLLGGFAVNKKRGGWDDLIPGFSGTSPSNTEVNSDTSRRPSNSKSSVIDDPFLVFESSGPKPDASWPFDPPSKAKQDTSQSSIDDFLMGTSSNNTRSATTQNGSDYMDAIFGGGNGVPQKNAAKQSSTTEDYPFGNFFHEKKQPEAKHTPPSSGTRNGSFPKNVGNDFTSLFGDITTTSGEFHEIDGEPEERRKARLNRHMRTNARMAEALAEKNQRDLQSQHEQEEKRRLAETLNNDIKRWAAGKEGNLRALLSSLQQILWPECGWRPVSLTDMITSESVKKVYKKATLSVHPDKVQQKGANVEQKYIAEKVFDILKEAWNKFSAEELR